MKHNQLLAAVKEVLFCEWDPIGVNDDERCRNEYDSYAPTICRMLEAGAEESKLAAHLRQLRINAMGLSDSDERQEHDRRVACRLLALLG